LSKDTTQFSRGCRVLRSDSSNHINHCVHHVHPERTTKKVKGLSRKRTTTGCSGGSVIKSLQQFVTKHRVPNNFPSSDNGLSMNLARLELVYVNVYTTVLHWLMACIILIDPQFHIKSRTLFKLKPVLVSHKYGRQNPVLLLGCCRAVIIKTLLFEIFFRVFVHKYRILVTPMEVFTLCQLQSEMLIFDILNLNHVYQLKMQQV
jgi:hypothetical protein